MIVSMNINGESKTATIGGFESLLRVLRDDLGLLGSKNACEQGECGSCSVILDGENVCACLVMAADCEGSEITTVEAYGQEGDLHPFQQAMLDEHGVQCGFCTPGIVVTGIRLLEENPTPSEDEIREALSGNICRCTGYGGILRAFERLAQDGEE